MGKLLELIHRTANPVERKDATPSPNTQGRVLSVAPAVRSQIVTLVRAVFLGQIYRPVRVIAFVDADTTTDSSIVCAYAADALASLTPTTVCVLDVNSDNVCAELFRVPAQPGLAEFMLGRNISDVTYQTSAGNLLVISSGGGESDVFGCFVADPDSQCSRMAELCKSFGYVLVAGQQLNGEESSMLARVTDGAVLVVAANTARREAATNVKRRLDALGVPVLGAVLTRSRSGSHGHTPLSTDIVRLL